MASDTVFSHKYTNMRIVITLSLLGPTTILRSTCYEFTFHVSAHLPLTHGGCTHDCFTGGETEAPRGELTLPGSHS